MKDRIAAFWIAARIWFFSNFFVGLGIMAGSLFMADTEIFLFGIAVGIIGGILSLPVLIIMFFRLPVIKGKPLSTDERIRRFSILCIAAALVYGLPFTILINVLGGRDSSFLLTSIWIISGLVASVLLSLYCSLTPLRKYFSVNALLIYSTQNKTMETTQNPESFTETNQSGSNRILIKGIITGALILLMMIPTVFIQNLVQERQERQKAVAAEVSSKWGSSQTLTGPYLYVPYKKIIKTTDGKTDESIEHFWIIPDEMDVSGNISHQIRPRSIYKVLLYRADLIDKGNFILSAPNDIDPNLVQWNEASICFSLTDFKGIEERLNITLNGSDYELSPGLPSLDIAKKGLSAPIALTISGNNRTLPFSIHLKIKGSEQLHFMPLSGNSSFALTSKWPNPSFDGNSLPAERNVSPNGFNAKWTFNKANLPFGTVLRDVKLDDLNLDFGVTMLEPADQYAKTSRSVKYAILFIGLTFGLFFIVELMQKKPFHPVQYVLIGIALVIFYTLLLSISEFLLFDLAYLVASLATILLITWYAAAHFRKWKTAGVFGGVLATLYGFIFVLIRLEDTALLVGSIGLFMVLALVMYASRKINWYGTTPTAVYVNGANV